MKKIIIANWKQNPQTITAANELLVITEKYAQQLAKSNIYVAHAVPTIFVGQLPQSNLILQNISAYTGGSHTGEISAEQGKSLGIPMSLVGHSETRLSPQNPHGDENQEINLKIKNLLSMDMNVCLCVGEYIREENYEKIIFEQIDMAYKGIPNYNLKSIVVAYEPVWAIGIHAKRAASTHEIVETIKLIKKYILEKYHIEQKVLYGGSVNENNARDILNLEPVDGLLIGRAGSEKRSWEQILDKVTRQGSVDYEGKKVLLRLDFNVPTNDKGEILNTHRIDEGLKTINLLVGAKAKVIIIAHKEDGSLLPVAKYLDNKLTNFKFVGLYEDFKIAPGQVVLLENIRLDKREKSKDMKERDQLGLELAGMADIFINDAFSASHRDHASITSVPKFVTSVLGPNFKLEVEKLNLALTPKHPLLLILGGAKFETKLGLLEKFIDVADRIFVGGALAHTFWSIQNYNLGKSLLDKEVKLSARVSGSEKVVLPIDVMIEDKSIKAPSQIFDTEKIVDFGPGTLSEILKIAEDSKTIIWNGPLGYYEGGYFWGTEELLRGLSKLTNKTVILGGGDTLTVLEKLESEKLQFTHVSSAGGAMIDYLSNGTLPGIEAINLNQNPKT